MISKFFAKFFFTVHNGLYILVCTQLPHNILVQILDICVALELEYFSGKLWCIIFNRFKLNDVYKNN